jgi:FkbM family methyltransferase
VRWVTTGYLRKPDRTFEYYLDLPHFLAEWDVWDYWEKERIHSMQQHLTTSDVLVDVGAEAGWMSLVFAEMVGPSNLILVEPTAEYWPNIKQSWERRFNVMPLATYCGLLGPEDKHGPYVYNGGWPAAGEGALSPARAYEYLHNEKEDVAVLTLDSMFAFDITPTALTMDVEGAELEVLKGAETMLENDHPKLWISVHPDLMARDYNTTPAELNTFLARFGYKGKHLATDHEEHWIFTA